MPATVWIVMSSGKCAGGGSYTQYNGKNGNLRFHFPYSFTQCLSAIKDPLLPLRFEKILFFLSLLIIRNAQK